ncbi:hypothetical protein U9M48_026615, partial [Paspalum notatum var. saurae]
AGRPLRPVRNQQRIAYAGAATPSCRTTDAHRAPDEAQQPGAPATCAAWQTSAAAACDARAAPLRPGRQPAGCPAPRLTPVCDAHQPDAPVVNDARARSRPPPAMYTRVST